MLLGYNTNGMAHHALPAAIDLVASLGFQSVAITIDHSALNPFEPGFQGELARTREQLDTLGLRSVIETGGRYLLDPRRKHHPTLVASSADDRQRRVAFHRDAIDAAAALGSDCVSLWAGIPEGDDRDASMGHLAEGLRQVLDYAEDRGVMLGFEPEPGMLIDTMASFEELLGRVDSPRLGLTLDIGHLHCLGEVPIAGVIRKWADRLVNVHIEDMRAEVHDHLMFGEGEIDFPPVIAALREVGYDGQVNVELSRHSHAGPAAAEAAYRFLAPLISPQRHEGHKEEKNTNSH